MYRALLLRGLTPAEAANLTAFACGLQVGTVAWTLGEVNRLLFLRDLRRTGRIGGADAIDVIAVIDVTEPVEVC